MQQPTVQMVTRAVDCLVVNGDVVLHQMPFAVLIAFTAAPMVIPVHQHHAQEDLM
jgi:hypothetical protein